MTTPSIQAVVQQMSSLAAQASGQPAGAAADKGGFAGELYQSIERINQLQAHAASQRDAFEAGDPNVSMTNMMVDAQKSGVAFEMGVQVRNRLVSAYRDIMNMQV